MRGLAQDVRIAVRKLWGSRGFAAAAVASLAIGIGANTAIFSVVNAVLFQPLPVRQPDRLINIYRSYAPGLSLRILGVSLPDAQDIRALPGLFDGVLSYELLRDAVTIRGRGEIAIGEFVSGDYFDVLGVRAALGRTLTPDDDVSPGREPVTVISDGYWRSRFAADPGVVGQTLRIRTTTLTVVGVMPPSFKGLWAPTMLAEQIWVPQSMAGVLTGEAERRLDRERGGLLVKARLAPGVTVERAQAALRTLAAQLEAAYPTPDARFAHYPRRFDVVPTEAVHVHETVDRTAFPIAGALMMLTGLVLLVACANVANFLLARYGARAAELALHQTLGATRWRLVRRLMAESLVLAAAGGAAGLVLAAGVRHLLVAGLPTLNLGIPFSIDPAVDPRLVGFALGVSVMTAALVGLVPAWRASRADLARAFAGESIVGRAARGWTAGRRMLVVAQMAVSLLLLLVAGLFARSLLNARRLDPGFETRRTAVISMDLRLHAYTEERGRQFYDRLRARASELAGVRSASLVQSLPIGGQTRIAAGWIEGRVHDPNRADYSQYMTAIDPSYFDTARIQLLAGRSFGAGDDAAGRVVAVLSETAARQMWPSQDAIGQRFTIRPDNDTSVEVVGVVADTDTGSLGSRRRGTVYVPFAQRYAADMSLLALGEGDGAALVAPLARIATELDPDVAVIEASAVSARLDALLYPRRVAAFVLGAFGVLAVLLAMIGLFGVTVYLVSLRTHEMGVRLALGARPAQVLRLVVAEGLRVAAVGIAAGLLVSFVAARLVAGLLYGVAPYDPVTFAGAPAVLAAVALLACWVPARRAARVDPVEALRHL